MFARSPAIAAFVLPRHQIGMILAHGGLGVFVIGAAMVGSSTLQRDVRIAPGETIEVSGYQFTLTEVASVKGPNWIADEARFQVARGDRELPPMTPQKRRYHRGGQIMTQVALRPGLTHDLYIAMGERLDDGQSWSMRVHIKPFVRWIWGGALFAGHRRPGYRPLTGATGKPGRLRQRSRCKPTRSRHEGSGMIRMLIPLLLFLVLVGLMIAGMQTADERKLVASPLIGRPVPDFALPGLHDPQVTRNSGDFLGQPWILNVWGSWCWACRVEHPVYRAAWTRGRCRAGRLQLEGRARRRARLD